MFARRSAVNTYAQVGVETGAMSASPHQLIVMLYDGARAAIARAKFHMAGGDIAAKGNAISKSIDIIDNGLRAVLDHNAGGDVAADLERLYDYMSRQLMLANLHNDEALLAQVDGLLQDLANAWAQISNPAANGEQGAPQPMVANS
ncbi:Flagellar biosynthesis protein FliS [Cupriavidus sp. U2]|uniref:flagellar export chaperone FliS n=1 Tax=Cupriavidus sp. U2 TaxID=2920269 RepID=UPI00129D3F5A|nr:flagellar export chaperone FliS [Cupriavidus sp. U2]KAI3590816.1 Flagellar biosynthesis protein FliS [Cupriavidus sp. U2]